MNSKLQLGKNCSNDDEDDPNENNDLELNLLDVTVKTGSQNEADRRQLVESESSASVSLDSSLSSNSSLSSFAYSWKFKTPKLKGLGKITLKWTGKAKEIFKIILVVSQLLLIVVLFNKIAILKLENAALHQRDAEFKIQARSANFVLDKYDISTSTTKPREENDFTVYSHNTSPSTSQPRACHWIEVFSEAELEKILHNSSEETFVCLRINCEDSSKWKMQNFSLETEMVKEIVLSGCFRMSVLSEILEKFNSVYKITFGQADTIFCNYDPHTYYSQYLHKPKTNLLNLAELVFQNINCTNIFEFLSKTFYMNGVTCLKIRNINITERNVLGIREILQQFKYSLEILHFTDVVWKVSLFENFSYDVPHLIELQMDFVAQNNTNVNFLRGFNAAEKILTINSLKGYLPYEQFSSIFYFKLMKKLVTGVQISDQVTTLDNLFPVELLPELESMELFLKLNNVSMCYLLSDYNVKRSYRIRLHSNCDVDF